VIEAYGRAKEHSEAALTERWPRMRESVVALVALGLIPGEDNDEAPLEKWEVALQAVVGPLSSEEAEALVGLFPPDLAHGLGFTLLHSVESAPSWGRASRAASASPSGRTAR